MSDMSSPAACAALILRVLATADGDVIVLHVGDRPSLIGADGQIDLSTEPMTLDGLEQLARALLSEPALSRHRTTSQDGIPEEYLAPVELVRHDDLRFPSPDELWAS